MFIHGIDEITTSIHRHIAQLLREGCVKLFNLPRELLIEIPPLPLHIGVQYGFFKITQIVQNFVFGLLCCLLYGVIIASLLSRTCLVTKCERYQHIIDKEFGNGFVLYNFNFFFILDIYFCISKDETLCFDNINVLKSMSEV